MFIETEVTPNPNTLKFLPGVTVLRAGTATFERQEDAADSPLAMRLFDVQGVEGVFLGQDFLTITKAQDADWSLLKPSILGAIMDHFTTGQAVITEDFELSDGHAEGDAADAEIITQIKELLDTHVRPAVANDGGDITFHGFKEGTVYLTMRGACSGCPSSTATLKHGIENLMRHYIPEVQQVEAVNG